MDKFFIKDLFELVVEHTLYHIKLYVNKDFKKRKNMLCNFFNSQIP